MAKQRERFVIAEYLNTLARMSRLPQLLPKISVASLALKYHLRRCRKKQTIGSPAGGATVKNDVLLAGCLNLE